MVTNNADSLVAIPGSDGILVPYGGIVLFSVTVENASAPANDLIIYDNTAASGTILAVIPANGPNQTYFVQSRNRLGLYVSNTSGWAGTIGLSS